MVGIEYKFDFPFDQLLDVQHHVAGVGKINSYVHGFMFCPARRRGVIDYSTSSVSGTGCESILRRASNSSLIASICLAESRSDSFRKVTNSGLP